MANMSVRRLYRGIFDYPRLMITTLFLINGFDLLAFYLINYAEFLSKGVKISTGLLRTK